MTSASQKKIIANNEQIIKRHLLTTIVILALHVLYRVILHWSSFSYTLSFLLLVTSIVYFYILRHIRYQSAPYEDEKGNLHVTLDLAKVSGSLTEYVFDILYVQWFCHLVGLFYDKIWFLYLVIPLFAVYKLFNFVLPMLMNNSALQQQLMQQQQQQQPEQPDRKSRRTQKIVTRRN